MTKSNSDVERIASKIMLSMAYDRSTFKDKVEEHVGGALLEFYKATLAKKNGKTRWVTHWMTEVRNLIDRNLSITIIHKCRGFKDRRKAINEVLSFMKQMDRSYRHVAVNTVKRDYGIDELHVELNDKDTDEFWKRVDSVVNSSLDTNI